METRLIRTEKGNSELRTRQHGLSPRARQLLLLIDGRRNPERLSRIFPRHELTAYIAVLENGKLIEVHNPDDQPGGLVGAANPVTSATDLREHVMRHVLATLGSSGEQFALRVARCKTRTEIEALIPAMQSVVEVSRGPQAARQFAQEAIVSE